MKKILHLVFAIVCISLLACSKEATDSSGLKEDLNENSIITLDNGVMIEKTDGYYVVRFPETRASSAMEIHIKGDRLYTDRHMWVYPKKSYDGRYIVGITPVILNWIGTIVYVDAECNLDQDLDADDMFGFIDSPGGIGYYELLMPWAGRPVERNLDLIDKPELLNQAPYDTWISRLVLYNFQEDSLMNALQYAYFISSL
mgnify:CR=1 FL=1